MPNENQQAYVQLTGNKLPIMALVSLISIVTTSIFYAAVWATKLDDRVLYNATQNSAQAERCAKLTEVVQAQQVVDERSLVMIQHTIDDIIRLRGRLDEQDKWNRSSIKRADESDKK